MECKICTSWSEWEIGDIGTCLNSTCVFNQEDGKKTKKLLQHTGVAILNKVSYLVTTSDFCCKAFNAKK